MKRIFISIASVAMLAAVSYAGEPYKAGDIVAGFSLKNTDGKMVSLGDYNNSKGFIVVFTCNTCPVAKKYEQRIIDLNSEFSSKGYPVIAINSNDKSISPGDSYGEMVKIARNDGYKFQYLYDETQEVAKRFGATNTPHVYVLTKENGNLKVEYVGAIDNNADDPAHASKKYVEDAVNALLQGKAVPVTSTRAIGCSIKWKKA